jgi:phosphate transport system substrate-binding protein
VNTKTRRRTAIVGGLMALSLIAAACGDDDDSDAGAATTAAGPATTPGGAATTAAAGGGGVDPACADVSATLNASGATFPQAFYEASIEAFAEEAPDITVNYGGGGSGKGRQDLADQVVDWAGTDGLIKEEDMAGFKGGEVLYFPTVLAPITLSYNLDVDELELTPDQISKIFQREVTNWSEVDPSLPDEEVTVAVRADGSGTTENFTKFVNAAVGDAGGWNLASGSTVQWPGGVNAAQGNSGVAQVVKDTAGAIGYVDLSDAKASGLKYASVQNKAGEFVQPTLEATSAAADGVEVKPDLTFFVGWADGDEAYPIAAQTWIIAYADQTDAAKGEALKCYLQFVLGPGQELAPEVDYAPLSESLNEQATAQLDNLQIP